MARRGAAKQDIILEVMAKGFADVQRSMRSWTSSFADLTHIARAAMGVMRAFSGSISNQIEAAAKLRVSLDQTRATIYGLGEDGEAGTQALLAWSDAMALATTKSQDAIIDLGRLAITLTGATDKAEEMTRAALALEAAGITKADAALKGLNQTLGGVSGTLARHIPELRNLTKEQLEAGDAIRLIAEKFGPSLDAQMESTVGQYARLSNIIEDRFLENMGLAIVNNDAFAEALRVVGDALVEIAPDSDVMMRAVHRVVRGMAGFVSTALGWVSSITSFLSTVYGYLGEFTSSIMEALLAPMRAMLRLGEIVSDFAGLPAGVTETFSLLRDSVVLLGDAGRYTFGGIADGMAAASSALQTAKDITDQATAAMDKYEGKTREAVKTHVELNAAVREYKELVIDLGDMTGLMEAENEALTRRQARIDMFMQWRMRAAEETAEHQIQQEQRAHEEAERLQAEALDRVERLSGAIANTIGRTFAAMITSTESARDLALAATSAIGNAMVDAAIQAVQAYIASGTAAAFFSQAGIPVIGPVLASAAAATAGAFLRSLLGQIRSFDTGGHHSQDATVNVHRGERTLNPRETREWEEWKGGRIGGGTGDIHVHAPLGMGDSVAVMRDLERAIIPALERAASTGRLSRTLALAGAR